MMVVSSNQHLVRDENGVVWIDKVNVKVIEVVLDHAAYGWSADEIHEQHPHLSLAQIHAALAYYYEHQAEFDSDIAQSLKALRGLRASVMDSPLQRRLRALAHAQ